MKKMKLRLWVKLTLCVIAIVLLLILDSKIVNDAVDKCVEGGRSEDVCIRELSK